ncbi:DUF2231 domain-containing protein [Coraliomargarita sp. W4R53]
MKYHLSLKWLLICGGLLLGGLLHAGELVNTMCPVTPEEPAEDYLTAEIAGQTVGFCCKKCLRQFNADPEAYSKQLQAMGVFGNTSEIVAEHPVDSHSDHAHDSHENAKSSDMHHAATSVETEHASGEAHDHATDHGDFESGASGAYLGKFHVLLVHLPIALLPLAALFECIGWRRQKTTWLHAARLNFMIGAAAAIAAAGLGWLAAAAGEYRGVLSEVLYWHRLLGLTVAGVAALALASLLMSRRSSRALMIYRVLLILLAVLIPVTAHFGGSLVYGVDYFGF